MIEIKKQTGLPLALALSLLAFPVRASSWQEADSGAVAILPTPENAVSIEGATLSCEEQIWGFILRLAPQTPVSETSMQGVLTVGRARFPIEGTARDGRLLVPLGADMLEPIRKAMRMGIEIGEGDNSLKAEFTLRASSAVIDAIAPRCSPVNMSAYRQLVPDEADAGIGVAEGLLADEVVFFRRATGRNPQIAARRMDLAEGRALLVASLCGSTAYYGKTGCSLFGFAQQVPSESWNLVYHTEGMKLYIDEETRQDGFPDLLTLPVGGAAEPSRWLWTGVAYEIGDAATLRGRHADSDVMPIPAKATNP